MCEPVCTARQTTASVIWTDGSNGGARSVFVDDEPARRRK